MDYSDLVSELLAKTALMFRSSWPKQMHTFIHGEMFILNYLLEFKGSAAPTELSTAMNASTARVAMALKTLESKGLVKRDTDQSDRRKIKVTITEQGSEFVKQHRAVMHARMEKILQELGEADAKEYIRITGRIVDISNELCTKCDKEQIS